MNFTLNVDELNNTKRNSGRYENSENILLGARKEYFGFYQQLFKKRQMIFNDRGA